MVTEDHRLMTQPSVILTYLKYADIFIGDFGRSVKYQGITVCIF
jgi:hypothetical protein